MKNIYSFIAILIALSFSACDITREPFQDVPDDKVFADELGIEAAALGTYALLKKNEFMRPYHFHGEFGGDNIALSGSTTDHLYYMYNYKHTKTNGHLNSLWSGCYKGIVNANKVIDKAQEGTARMNHVIGEMYYLRAFFYFNLVNVWGRPYPQNPNSNLGVPIILDAEPNADNLPPRATVKEVYELILTDLLKAADLMSEFKRVDDYNIYASEQAANALLSRVYLYMEDNQKAEEYASKVIDSNNFTLLEGSAYETFPTMVPEENSEIIFACKALKDKDDYNWYAFGGMYATIQGVGWGEMYASEPLRDLLDRNPSDRRHKFIDPQYEDGDDYEITYSYDKSSPAGSRMFKMYDVTSNAGNWEYDYNGTKIVSTEVVNGNTLYFITEGENIIGKTYVKLTKKMPVRQGYPKYFVIKCSNQEGQPQLFSPVISRLAEMYLNRAEARAKIGANTSGALDDINVIRERADIDKYTDVPAGRTLLEIILEERRIELAFEAHRRYDIFRNGLTLDRRYPGTHDRGANPLLTVPATSPRVVDFIPEAQILAQPNLEQNP